MKEGEQQHQQEVHRPAGPEQRIEAPRPSIALSPEKYTQLVQEHEAQDQRSLTAVREEYTDLLPQPLTDRPKLHDLKTKLGASGAGKEYTAQESFYLEHGWKAYLQEYGGTGYTLEDIARTEKLDASEIRTAIAEGIVTDTKALSLYGKLRIEQAEAYFTQWAEKRRTDPEYTDEDHAFVEQTKAREMAAVYREYSPLALGNRKDLAAYSLKQARYDITVSTDKKLDLSEQDREHHTASAQNWIALTERILAQQANEAPTDKAAHIPEASQLTSEQQKTMDYLQTQPKTLDALGALQTATAEDLQAMSEQLKHERPTLIEQKGAGWLDLLLALIEGLTEAAKQTIKAA